MPPSDHKRKDSLPARHRSHKGCWTCKRKRIQCDEIRPACQQCAKKGIACEGYEIRLRWGAGIASRGRFNGAQKPVQESIPPHSKRRWDLRGKVDHSGNDDQQGQPTLLLEQEFIQAESLSHTAEKRATVNILNAPFGQDPQDYININKHFELPVSTENEKRLGEDRGAIFYERQSLEPTSYSSRLPGLSAILA